jgi:hypothetical protein
MQIAKERIDQIIGFGNLAKAAQFAETIPEGLDPYFVREMKNYAIINFESGIIELKSFLKETLGEPVYIGIKNYVGARRGIGHDFEFYSNSSEVSSTTTIWLNCRFFPNRTYKEEVTLAIFNLYAYSSIDNELVERFENAAYILQNFPSLTTT